MKISHVFTIFSLVIHCFCIIIGIFSYFNVHTSLHFLHCTLFTGSAASLPPVLKTHSRNNSAGTDDTPQTAPPTAYIRFSS